MAIEESVLARLPYWNELRDDEKALIRQHAFTSHYKKGDFVHDRDNECLGMILVLRGSLRVSMLSEEGREITLFRLYEGDPCVLSASCAISQITFETQITAEQDTTLLVISTSFFSSLTEKNIHVKCFRDELIAERFSTVMQVMQDVLFKGFDRRLASFFVKEYERTGQTVFHMTHEEIALLASSAREVVARMLKRFVADGLVELRRGEIRLLDLEELKLLAK